MHYQEWKALPESVRIEIKRNSIVKEGPRSSEIYEFAQLAAQDLKLSVEELPGVMSVRVANRSATGEPILVICGNLPPQSASVPSQFCGFDVEIEDFSDLAQKYLNTWREILKRILEWSDVQISEWCRKWEPSLHGQNPIIYHRPPAYYAARPIAETLSMNKDPESIARFTKYVENVISEASGGNSHPDTIENFPWAQVKDAVRSRA